MDNMFRKDREEYEKNQLENIRALKKYHDSGLIPDYVYNFSIRGATANIVLNRIYDAVDRCFTSERIEKLLAGE